jgi:hypothetical protein
MAPLIQPLASAATGDKARARPIAAGASSAMRLMGFGSLRLCEGFQMLVVDRYWSGAGGRVNLPAKETAVGTLICLPRRIALWAGAAPPGGWIVGGAAVFHNRDRSSAFLAANSSDERTPFFCKSARRSILAKMSVSWTVAEAATPRRQRCATSPERSPPS